MDKHNLADLRTAIDRIDEDMHRLLIERGDVIDALIKAKGTTASGQAFRPNREVQMMRALAGRHQGLLPLEAVEGIWRIIIATFTHAQAPYTVHYDGSDGEQAMRDCARFHFGFTPPVQAHEGPQSVIASVAASRGDLGLIAITHEAATPWWRDLIGADAPKIIARLPFLAREGHPAGLPVFVIARPLDEEPGEIRLYADAPGTPVTCAADGSRLAASVSVMPDAPFLGSHAAPWQVQREEV